MLWKYVPYRETIAHNPVPAEVPAYFASWICCRSRYSERTGDLRDLARVCGMRLVYKRSSPATALAMPEETYASEPEGREPSRQEPAPAGALHRVYPTGQAAAHEDEAEPYLPQRGSYGMRVRGGMPRSVAGRVVLACGAFTVVAALALAAAAVRRFFLEDPRFMLNSSSAIAVRGNQHISRADVLGVFGVDLERNIFRLPLAERRADLQRLPWVEHATVMRLLPNHVRVEVVERTPVAFTRQGTQIGLVDGDGVMLDMPPESAGDPHYSFPVLTGLALDDSAEVRASRMEVYRRFMADLASQGPKVTQSLSEVDVTNPEDVKALITDGGADILVHFGDGNFVPRYQAFERHLPEWRTQYPRLASADMRYERQVVLEMQPDGNAPLPAEMSIAGTGAHPAEVRRFTERAAPGDAMARVAMPIGKRPAAVRSAEVAKAHGRLTAAHRAELARGSRR